VKLIGEGTVRYWHLTLQEFLAAEELGLWDGGDEGAEAWWPVIREQLDQPQWAETIDLFPACLLPHGEGQVEKLLRRLLALRASEPGLVGDARALGRLHRMLDQLEVYKYRPPKDIARIYAELMENMRGLFTPEGAAKVPWKVRIPAVEALGRADFRLQEPIRRRMLEVPGRPGLLLGKYPVTVLEYESFVAAGGYEERAYWDDEGWTMRAEKGWVEPGGWEEQRTTPNRPVVGVSWFEAMAYCAWLAELEREGYRLPTEDEWQAAATNPAGEYPWGEPAPTPEHANYGDNIDRPSPVGCYPLGEAPGRHLDLAGNVWEWCVDKVLTNERRAPQTTPLKRAPFRGLRGGGCWGGAGDLRSAHRGSDRAGYRHGGIGFRLALSPASLAL
jgi:formylglycine-generating enzyme required for sulfatase activity